MKSKTKYLVVGIVVFALFVGTNSMAAEKKWEIVFTTKNSVNPWYKACWVGGQRAAAEYKDKVNISYSSPTKSDNIAEQTSMMEDLILKRPDAIVFVPTDYVALVPTVAKMNKAGIPVFNYSNEIAPGAEKKIFVGGDYEKQGYEISKYVFKAIGGKGKVIFQDGVPGADSAQLRKKGFLRAAKEMPGIEVLTIQPANYNRVMAMQVMENLLQRFPKIDAVVACNDEQALGCLEAIEAAGRMKEIKVVGIDANHDAATAITNGRLFASADNPGLMQGYLCTKACIKFLMGEKIPKRIFVPITIVTKENAKPWTMSFEDRPLPDWDKIVKDAELTAWQ